MGKKKGKKKKENVQNKPESATTAAVAAADAESSTVGCSPGREKRATRRSQGRKPNGQHTD
jgi:hypothetical protein